MTHRNQSAKYRTRHPGRPPLPDAKRHDHEITVCLTKRQLAFIESNRGPLSRSAWIRQAIFGNLPPIVPSLNRATWHSLGQLGGDLNQLIRNINLGKIQAVDGVDLRALKEEVDALRALVLSDRRKGVEGVEK